MKWVSEHYGHIILLNMETGFTTLRFCTSLLMMIYRSSLCIASETASQICAHGGINYDGRCFWFIDTKASWADANIMCSRLFGDHVTLTTIKDAATNTFIRSQSEATLWIGLHEGHGEGQWRWVDHSLPSGKGNHVYTNWETSAPTADSLTKNCAVMYRGSEHWRDVGCRKKHKFVCSELPSAPICSNGGTFFRDRCYWAAEEALPWEEANAYCSEHFGPGTYLTTAKDWEVNLFLSRLIYPGIWLGLHDTFRENDWKWIDNSPLEYSNWRPGEPNNLEQEDCAVLHYDDATWNDQPCGGENSTIPNSNRFICSVPPCFDDTTSSGMSSISGLEDLEIYDDVICVTTECSISCINGAACNSTTGTCMCVKQFPHMVCDAAEWQITAEESIVNATTGGSLSIKCMHNFPQEDIVFLTWSRLDGGALDETRTSIYNVFHKGYSQLEITNINYHDAGVYHCQGLITTPDGNTNLYRSAVVTITVTEATTEGRVSTTIITTAPREESTAVQTTTDHPMTTMLGTTSNKSTTKPKQSNTHTTIGGDDISTYINKNTPTVTDENNEIPVTKSSRFTKVAKDEENQIPNHVDSKVNSEASKDLKVNTYHRGRGATATIVILAIMVALLLIAVVGLMLKVRRLEYASFGASRLVEMSDRF